MLWDDTDGNTPFDYHNKDESRVRSAIRFVATLKTPTWYFEGASSGYCPDALEMAQKARGLGVPFSAFIIPRGDHRNILRPITKLIASKIAHDVGPTCTIKITEQEVTSAFNKEFDGQQSTERTR